jgi:hypothetical protein
MEEAVVMVCIVVSRAEIMGNLIQEQSKREKRQLT